MTETEKGRDRQISRRIHKLFWYANIRVSPGTFTLWLFTRPLAVFVYNVLIPIQVAYGLQAIIQGQFSEITRHVITILVLATTYSVLWTIGGFAICRNGEKALIWLQQKVFSNLLNKDFEYYNSTYVGALGAQAIRIREALNEYNQVMVNAFPGQLVVVVCSIAVIAYNSLTLAFITVLCMGATLSFTLASSQWRLRYRRKLSEASSELAGVVGDALGQVQTVKTFAAEEYEQQRLQTSVVAWARRQYQSWLSSIPSDVGRTMLAAGATGVLLIFTSRLYQQGAISIAIVTLVQLYVVRLISITHDMADTLKVYESAMGGAYQSVKTMLVEPTISDDPAAQRLPKKFAPTVTFSNVTYRYADAKASQRAVADFSLDATAGERVGLVGYSGSGKTTLTKLLLRFNDVTSGSIAVGGVDIRKLAQADLRKQIAYVPQEPLLFHRSVLENIAYGRPGAPRKEVIAAAKAAYIDEFVQELPNGYDTVVGERGVKLSGGQRQRVAIARAILKDAPILVLDEATSALDSRSELFIQKALWKLMKGRTALVIAHRLSTIQRMERIVVMHKGKIVQQGTHQALLKEKKGIYAELWSHQSGGYVGIPKPGSEAA